MSFSGNLLHDEILETNHIENYFQTSDKSTEKISQTHNPTVRNEASVIVFRFFCVQICSTVKYVFFKVPVGSL